MTETHTPLPWAAQVLETENDPGVYIVGSNLGGLVGAALPWPTEIESGDYSRVEANAALIVHAVNSHHDLIEALRALAKEFRTRCRSFDNKVLAEAEAILTKAEAGHG